MVLRWVPPVTVAPTAARYVRIDIYRLAENRTERERLSIEEYLERANIAGFIDLRKSPIGEASQYLDVIDTSGKTNLAAVRLRYAIVYVRDDDVGGGLSNFASVEPAAAIADPPAHLVATVTQDELWIDWKEPAKNIDGTAPASLVGYNVYRESADGSRGFTLRNETPFIATRYSERRFEFKKTYHYFVRAVSLASGQTVESADSELVTVTPIDTFPPSAPASVTIASVAGTISLFWPSNPESDVIGYNVYRSEDPAVPPEKWQRINATLIPHPPTAFRDSGVEIGKRYYYKVTALDRFLNESKRSETVSEVVNT